MHTEASEPEKCIIKVTEKIPGFFLYLWWMMYNTTGSTADAMAMCLLEAGAEKVYFLTICAGRA